MLETSSISSSREAYISALKLADQKVKRLKEHASGDPNAISSAVLRALFGRYYQVGDRWDVAALRFDHSVMRMTSDPEQLKTSGDVVALFHYEVIKVKTGMSPQVVIKVTQVESNGIPILDPKVTELTLTMNDQLVQSDKAYLFKGASQPVKVSPDGIRSRITPLELFPLDVPDVVTAERQDAISLPELPGKLQSVAAQAGFKPDFAKSSWFEQDDFFGRPVQILWQQGDPWPAYLKTPNGIAILLHKEV